MLKVAGLVSVERGSGVGGGRASLCRGAGLCWRGRGWSL